MVEKGVLKDVDVYHVSHHAADTSSYKDFLDIIKPEVCIVSSGTVRRYKHPRKKTIERLTQLSTSPEIYQLNKNTEEHLFTSKIKNAPDNFIADLDCTGDEGTILIEVFNNNYTVKMLNRNIEKKTYNFDY